MFCKYCNSLDLDAAAAWSDGNALHHESFVDLVASADNGCELCKWIADSAKIYGPERFQECLHSGERIYYSYSYISFSLEWRVGRYKSLANLYICAAKDDPISKIVHCRPVCSDVRSEGFYRQIRTWIKACSRKHLRCQPRGRSRLPTRVIDVGDSRTSPYIFVSSGQYGQWVALSYCWGNQVPLRTLSGNLESFQEGISLKLLPPLFQDAITIVRRLGYRYLWIDALCIIQDSETDWLNESAKMGGIFLHATLTILAESAEDSSLGLFSSMEQKRQAPSIMIRAHSRIKHIQGHVSTGIYSGSTRGPLSRRAWTMQEDLLSPCVIRFAESQVWWQCREAFRSETFPDSLRESPSRQQWVTGQDLKLTKKLNKYLFKPHNQDVRPKLLKSWYAVVTTYSGRQSTYLKDTFPAISGIARQYCRHGLQDYKAGLWLEDVHQGLLWNTSPSGGRRTITYIAPSWSWASMDLGFSNWDYNWTLITGICTSPLTCVARIERVDVALLSGDPFGQIKAAKIGMTGPSIQICRNDVPCEFMDIRYKHSEVERFYTYSSLETPRDDQERGLHWSLRKTATCNIWTVESVTRKSPHPPQHPCLLLHVASHQALPTHWHDWRDEPRPRYAFCLILEQVPDGEDLEASEQDESIDTDDQSGRSEVGIASETDTQTLHLDKKTAKKTVQYRRIGLAILQETVPTSTIWSEETVTII